MLRSDQSWGLCEALEFPSQAELNCYLGVVCGDALVARVTAAMAAQTHFINVFIVFSCHYSSPDFLGGNLENCSAIRKISGQFIQRLIA
jgi:hypothetical protein